MKEIQIVLRSNDIAKEQLLFEKGENNPDALEDAVAPSAQAFDGALVAGKALFLGDLAAATVENLQELLSLGRDVLRSGHERRESGKPALATIPAFHISKKGKTRSGIST